MQTDAPTKTLGSTGALGVEIGRPNVFGRLNIVGAFGCWGIEPFLPKFALRLLYSSFFLLKISFSVSSAFLRQLAEGGLHKVS